MHNMLPIKKYRGSYEHTILTSLAIPEFRAISALLEEDHDNYGLGAGHVRKARPELYSRKWTAECDLILVGDLLQSCGISDLDAQGQELMHAMQAGTMSTTQALQHPWLM